MSLFTIAGLIIVIPVVIFTISAYVNYRKELNKKNIQAKLDKKEINNPTIGDDSKSCLSIVVIVIIASIIFLIIYGILHWFAPGIFPSIDVN